MAGGVSAAIRRWLPAAAGRGPGFELQSGLERVSLEPPGGPLEGSGKCGGRRGGEAAFGRGWIETPAAS